MSDDLVKRLREAFVDFDDMKDAADRIEELEAKLEECLECNEQFAVEAKILKARIEELEAKLAKAVEALTQIERAYYQEATNPRPETVRRMAARMNGIARDTQNTLANLTGGKDE